MVRDSVLVILMRHLTTRSVNLITMSLPLSSIRRGTSPSSSSRAQKEYVLHITDWLCTHMCVHMPASKHTHDDRCSFHVAWGALTLLHMVQCCH